MAYGFQACVSIQIAIFPHSFVCNLLCMLFSAGQMTVVQHWKASWRDACVPSSSTQALLFVCKEEEGRKMGCVWLHPLFARIRTFWRDPQGWKNPVCAVLYVSTPTEWIGIWPSRVIEGKMLVWIHATYSDLCTRVSTSCEHLSETLI